MGAVTAAGVLRFVAVLALALGSALLFLVVVAFLGAVVCLAVAVFFGAAAFLTAVVLAVADF